MMRWPYLSLFLCSVVPLGLPDSAVARPATVVGRDWCEGGLDAAVGAKGWKDLEAPAAVVSADGFAEAMRLLEKRSILPITPRTAERLGGRVLPGSGKLYLARSGIFARPDAGPSQVLLQARNASFRRILWDSKIRALVNYTMQIQDERGELFPAPLIVRLSVAPLRARSFCDFYY